MFGPPMLFVYDLSYVPNSAERLLLGAELLEVFGPVDWDNVPNPFLDKLAKRFAESPKVLIFRALVEDWTMEDINKAIG